MLTFELARPQDAAMLADVQKEPSTMMPAVIRIKKRMALQAMIRCLGRSGKCSRAIITSS